MIKDPLFTGSPVPQFDLKSASSPRVRESRMAFHGPTWTETRRSVARQSRLDTLSKLCLADVIAAFGLTGSSRRLAHGLLRRALATPVKRIAQGLLVFDAIVGKQGLQQGGEYFLTGLVRDARAQGQNHVPRRGPLLLVSNHPGLADAAALLARLPRADVRVIAAQRPLLAALPETVRHLIFVPDRGMSCLTLVRQAANHMREGGAVLTFPAGRIEPDPAIRPGALAALDEWSACADVFARLVPELTIVPVIVSGVLSRSALRHPLTRLRRNPRDREWLAATLQMLMPALGDVTTEVAFGAPIHVPALAAGQSADAAVNAQARQLIETTSRTAQ